MMIMLGKAMGFVADILEEAQGVGVAAQVQWLFGVHHVNQFLSFGERQHARRLDIQRRERRERRAELPFAAVNEENVGGEIKSSRTWAKRRATAS